jgi:hypothetical protein
MNGFRPLRGSEKTMAIDVGAASISALRNMCHGLASRSSTIKKTSSVNFSSCNTSF